MDGEKCFLGPDGVLTFFFFFKVVNCSHAGYQDNLTTTFKHKEHCSPQKLSYHTTFIQREGGGGVPYGPSIGSCSPSQLLIFLSALSLFP